MKQQITKEEFLNSIQLVKEYLSQVQEDINMANKVFAFYNIAHKTISEVDFTVRTYNVLNSNKRAWGIGQYEPFYLKDIPKIKLSDIKNFRNAGPAVLREIKEVCEEAGLEIQP